MPTHNDTSAIASSGEQHSHRFLVAEGLRPMMLFFWSLVVGSLVGFVGAVFQSVLTAIGAWHDRFVTALQSFPVLSAFSQVLFSALVVYVAFLLVRRFAPETGGSGVHEVEGALDNLRPLRWHRVLPVKFLGGVFSLSGGLVLGREGPTIQMGGNIGKMIGDVFHLSEEDLHTLVAAGAGAGLAAAFNAPLAGILFVIEEMRPQFKYNFLSVHSVLIACASSDIVVRLILGQTPDIAMLMVPAPPLEALWLFPVLGVFFGIFGAIFNQLLVKTLDFFADMTGWRYTLTGLYVGAAIGFLSALFPGVVGGGYEIIPRALKESVPLTMLLILFFSRFATTMISYGSGAPGGIFAPMLALATIFGMWSGYFAHAWFPTLIVHPQIFAVAGMGALFSATVRAPLTGIALTIEMTDNYSLILPLIMTCMVAAMVAQGLRGRPIYTVLLKRTLDRAGRSPVTNKG